MGPAEHSSERGAQRPPAAPDLPSSTLFGPTRDWLSLLDHRQAVAGAGTTPGRPQVDVTWRGGGARPVAGQNVFTDGTHAASCIATTLNTPTLSRPSTHQHLLALALVAVAAASGAAATGLPEAPPPMGDDKDFGGDLKGKVEGFLGDALSAKQAAVGAVKVKEASLGAKLLKGYPFDLYPDCIRTAEEYVAAYEAGVDQCVAPWIFVRATDSPADVLNDPEAAFKFIKGPQAALAFVSPGPSAQGILTLSADCKANSTCTDADLLAAVCEQGKGAGGWRGGVAPKLAPTSLSLSHPSAVCAPPSPLAASQPSSDPRKLLHRCGDLPSRHGRPHQDLWVGRLHLPGHQQGRHPVPGDLDGRLRHHHPGILARPPFAGHVRPPARPGA